MTHEFKRIVGLDQQTSIWSFMEDWPLWKTRILAYSDLEKTNRPKLRELLSSLDGGANEGDLMTPNKNHNMNAKNYIPSDITAMQLLSELLIPKTKRERLIHSIKVM